MRMIHAKLPRVALFFVCLQMVGFTWADTLLTREGKTLKGKIELVAKGILKIGDAEVLLRDLKRAEFEQPQAPKAPTPNDEPARLTAGMWAVEQAGVLCWSGSFLARKVVAVDDTKVTFEDSPKELFLSTVNTAAVFFGRVSLAHANKLRNQRKPGVLLASGNFVEGRLKSVADGAVVVDSVLFGRKSFAAGTQAVALWLQKPKPVAARFTLHMQDGSILLVREPTLKNGALILNGSPFQNYRIVRDDLIEIRNGDAADVLTQAWARIDQAPRGEKPMLLAPVQNVGRTLQLRKLMQFKNAQLREAKLLLAKAEVARAAGDANRNRAKQDWDRLRNMWQRENRAYFRTRAGVLRSNAQARSSQRNVDRMRRDFDKARREVENRARKLEDCEKKLARAKANPQQAGRYRGKRDEAMRALDRARKTALRMEQRMISTRRDHDQKQAAAKPLTAKETTAKQTLAQAKRDSDEAQRAYHRALAEWRVVIQEATKFRSRVAQLQREHDETAAELESSLMPRIPEIDLPR